jgi:hypothetical protein
VSEARVVSTGVDHEIIEIDGHSIQYGGAEGGWCSTHNNFECVEKLSPEQCRSVATAKPVIVPKEKHQLIDNMRRIEELRGAADSIAEFVIGAVNVLDDEKEKLHVIDMVIMRLSRGVATALEASEPDSATSAIRRLADQFGWSGFTILQGTLCGPTGDEMFCACGCGGDDTRCEYWLTMRNLGQEVADSHTCCKVGKRESYEMDEEMLSMRHDGLEEL